MISWGLGYYFTPRLSYERRRLARILGCDTNFEPARLGGKAAPEPPRSDYGPKFESVHLGIRVPQERTVFAARGPETVVWGSVGASVLN